MFARLGAGAVGLMFLAALIFAGVAAAALAIGLALAPAVGAVGAAALTALIFLLGPLIVAIILLAKSAARRSSEETLIRSLSLLAKDAPLIAIAGAGILGLLEFLLRRRKR